MRRAQRGLAASSLGRQAHLQAPVHARAVARQRQRAAGKVMPQAVRLRHNAPLMWQCSSSSARKGTSACLLVHAKHDAMQLCTQRLTCCGVTGSIVRPEKLATGAICSRLSRTFLLSKSGGLAASPASTYL